MYSVGLNSVSNNIGTAELGQIWLQANKGSNIREDLVVISSDHGRNFNPKSHVGPAPTVTESGGHDYTL